MIRTLFTSLVFLSSSIAFAQHSTTSPAPIQLFNSHDLIGWTVVTKTPPTTGPAEKSEIKTWTVHDGVLHCSGTPNGYLRTDIETPENFVLTVEQRHIVKGNGGIFFALTGPDKVWPRELEVQGQTGDEGDLRGVTQFKMTTDPARTDGRRLKKMGPISEKPIGERELVEITVQHGKITIKLNGIIQNEATATESLKGHVALQSEGAEMEFRKLELIDLGG